MSLKQALNHGLIFKKVQKVINLIKMLKPCIDMNTKLRQKAKKYFFGKTMENVRKHFKLVTT